MGGCPQFFRSRYGKAIPYGCTFDATLIYYIIKLRMGKTMMILEPKDTRSLYRMEDRIKNALTFIHFLLSLKNSQSRTTTQLYIVLQTVMTKFQTWLETEKETNQIRFTEHDFECQDLWQEELNKNPDMSRRHFRYFTGKWFMSEVRRQYRDIEGLCRIVGIKLHTRPRSVRETLNTQGKVEELELSMVYHPDR